MELTPAKDDLHRWVKYFVNLLKTNTARAYEKDLTDFLIAVSEFNIKTVLSYFQTLVAKGYSKTTIDRKRASLSKFLDFLVENGVIPTNPLKTKTFAMFYKKIVQEVERGRKKSKKPEPRYLKWEEVERMLSSCPNTIEGKRDRLIVLLGVYEGLRRSEIVNLTWDDLREDGLGTVLVIRGAKGGTDTVVVHERVLRELNEFRKMLSESGIETPYIVPSLRRNKGGKMSTVELNRRVKLIAKRSGIEDWRKITAHDLRHTCAVQMLLHGAHVNKVAEHLRHKNIQTTMRYLRTLEKHIQAGVKCLPG